MSSFEQREFMLTSLYLHICFSAIGRTRWMPFSLIHRAELHPKLPSLAVDAQLQLSQWLKSATTGTLRRSALTTE